MHPFYEIIFNRRSIRKFRPDLPSRQIIRRIIEAGTWAPSAHNAQPWRFFVLESSTAKMQLAIKMGDAFRKDLIKEGEQPEKANELVNASIERFSKAPVLVIVCLTMDEMDVYMDSRRQQAETVMGIQSVAAAIQNLLLAAHMEGLGACWFCAPLFCQDIVREVLKLPVGLVPQALITLGIPDESPEQPVRKAVSEILTFSG